MQKIITIFFIAILWNQNVVGSTNLSCVVGSGEHGGDAEETIDEGVGFFDRVVEGK